MCFDKVNSASPTKPTSKAVDGCGFACPVGSQQAEELVLLDGKPAAADGPEGLCVGALKTAAGAGLSKATGTASVALLQLVHLDCILLAFPLSSKSPGAACER